MNIWRVFKLCSLKTAFYYCCCPRSKTRLVLRLIILSCLIYIYYRYRMKEKMSKCIFVGHVPMGVKENIYEPQNIQSENSECAVKNFSTNDPRVVLEQCSNALGLNRSIPDSRLEECKFWQYSEKLPLTTVVIVYHNEVTSVLLRTINSVYTRSPKNILEILVIDDASTTVNNTQVQELLNSFGDTGRLIRNEKQMGITKCRNKAGEWAVGDVVVFLISNCEVGYNWLPPLIVPIQISWKLVLVPEFDTIDYKSLRYLSNKDACSRGKFRLLVNAF